MANNSRPKFTALVREVEFIEEHSEYVFEQTSPNIYNDMRTFIKKHYKEAYINYEEESIWDYCDATESDIW